MFPQPIYFSLEFVCGLLVFKCFKAGTYYSVQMDEINNVHVSLWRKRYCNNNNVQPL